MTSIKERPGLEFRAVRAVSLIVFFLFFSEPVRAETLRAFSLEVLKGEAARGKPVEHLGAPPLTNVRAFVVDPEQEDVILVGSTQENKPPVTVSDLVVAMRSVMVERAWPSVSIEKTADTDRTELQRVTYGGGIQGTFFGQALLEADVTLKNLGLGEIDASVWGVTSYLSLRAEEGPDRIGRSLRSRFWFTTDDPVVVAREGIGIVHDCRVRVDARQAVGEGLETEADTAGLKFASQLTASYYDLSLYYPEVARLQQLFYLVGLSAGLDSLLQRDPELRERLQYWLEEYEVTRVEPKATYPLRRASRKVQVPDGEYTLEIDGGIELRALVLDLEEGLPSAIREVVLRMRPSAEVLEWQLPLTDEYLDSLTADSVAALDTGILDVERIPGLAMSLESRFRPLGTESDLDPRKIEPQPRRNPGDPFRREVLLPPGGGGPPGGGPGLMPPMPGLWTISGFLGANRSTDIGGVMLSGTAATAEGGPVDVDLSRNGFSLIIGGSKARLAPEAFRRFVTALWAVYYSDVDPGISIDPIAPDVDKHLVRYIGNVINSDLGRVMREADYLMKEWAVGTKRPSIPGFSNPDDISGRRRSLYLAASRFWFVPEGMKFRRSGDMLLFDEGRMTVRTEYLSEGARWRADLSNEEFARWFTREYDKVAELYPVYAELFDYAKLVALVKYLKERGVPLHWFLMANKHLVLTEDSPGTVDELAKGSEHFKNIRISGGVELTSDSKFVFDEEAVAALRTAWSSHRPTTGTSMVASNAVVPVALPSNLSFDVGDASYTVVPQHGLTSGRDYRGIRYQTDIATRRDTEPGLEVVRYFDPSRPEGGEFGQGWRLLLPYRVSPVGEERQDFLNVSLPVKMCIRHLLTGTEEILTFSTERYSIAGWVPDELADSQFVGLFLLSDATFRLADKIGNEFSFDQEGYLTAQLLGKNYRMTVEYLSPSLEKGFDGDPYQLEPADEDTEEFLNVLLPSRMKVVDLQQGTEEVLHFRGEAKIAGYYPEDTATSRLELLALLSDASYRLLDRHGNEIAFRGDGRFNGFAVSEDGRMIRSIALGDLQRLELRYRLDPTGRIAVSSALLFDGEDPYPRQVLHYRYDETGRLARVEQGARAGAGGLGRKHAR